MPLGKPAFVTPNAGTDKALPNWQMVVNNIRERFGAVEATIVALQNADTAAALSVAGTNRSVQAQIAELRRLIAAAAAFAELFDTDGGFEDGDIWIFRDEFNQFVAEPGGSIGSGGVLPVVTGEILDDQPVFVYLDDGSLVYAPVED
jgi:hypothetical protein